MDIADIGIYYIPGIEIYRYHTRREKMSTAFSSVFSTASDV